MIPQELMPMLAKIAAERNQTVEEYVTHALLDRTAQDTAPERVTPFEMYDYDRIHLIDVIAGLKKVKTGSVMLQIADPPYHQGVTHNGVKGTPIDLEITAPFFSQLFREMKRVRHPKGSIYFFCDWRGSMFYYKIMQEIIGVKNLIVWDKISGAGNFYAFTHELILFYCPNDKNMKGQNIWRTKGFTSGAQVTNGAKQHPTQKPQEIIERMILDATTEGDLVVDLFSGSGTTSVTAQTLNRRFIGFELQQEYHHIAIERLNQPRQSKINV